MNATVEVPEAELRTVLDCLAAADQTMRPMLSLVPGYTDACQAHAVLSVLLRDAVEGMPPDPVAGMDMAAVGHHEVMASYARAGFEDGQAWQATLEYIRATALAAAGMEVSRRAQRG